MNEIDEFFRIEYQEMMRRLKREEELDEDYIDDDQPEIQLQTPREDE